MAAKLRPTAAYHAGEQPRRNGTFLQPRTLEALFWRSKGLGQTEVAVKMGTKVKTVQQYATLASGALGVPTRDLFTFIVRGGEIKPRA